MKLSVIVPCYNEANTIATQLEALTKQAWSEPWEVIVSDNGSTDYSLAIVETYRSKLPHLRIVDASTKRGAPHAINVGVQAATGGAIAVCDADDEVAPGWVAAIGEALARHDFVASRFDFTKLNEPWAIAARSCGYGTCGQENGLQKIGHPPYLLFAGGCGLGVKKSIHDASVAMMNPCRTFMTLNTASKFSSWELNSTMCLRLSCISVATTRSKVFFIKRASGQHTANCL